MWVWLLWRVVWQCLLKLKIGVPFDPVSPWQAPILEKGWPMYTAGGSSMFITAAEHPV